MSYFNYCITQLSSSHTNKTACVCIGTHGGKDRHSASEWERETERRQCICVFARCVFMVFSVHLRENFAFPFSQIYFHKHILLSPIRAEERKRWRRENALSDVLWMRSGIMHRWIRIFQCIYIRTEESHEKSVYFCTFCIMEISFIDSTRDFLYGEYDFGCAKICKNFWLCCGILCFKFHFIHQQNWI